MARFATYYLRYKKEPLVGPYEWEKRQEHLASLFDNDNSIVFGEGQLSDKQCEDGIPYAKVFNHRVYHLKCNSNIIVMQFANSIDIPVESKFEQTVVKDEPSLFVIIDNRKDGIRRLRHPLYRLREVPTARFISNCDWWSEINAYVCRK